MIIVAGWIEVDPKDRDLALASRREAILAAKSEQGCLDYIFSADPIEPGRIRLFERWESLADHHEHERISRLGQSTSSRMPPVHVEVHTYTVSDSTPWARAG
ncbi:MAG TPA: antibiotic biosynthesis monooxygenase [Acidimicrobiales bacterium]|nr:antibiotic biosynthesis monooxygenase [Acidimicrobiales bacterium]